MRADANTLIDKKIRSKDGLLVGHVRRLEVDLQTLQITGFKMETSRDLLERLSLAEPAITGGRVVMLNTDDVDHVEEEVILKIDALDLAKLNFGKLDSVV